MLMQRALSRDSDPSVMQVWKVPDSLSGPAVLPDWPADPVLAAPVLAAPMLAAGRSAGGTADSPGGTTPDETAGDTMTDAMSWARQFAVLLAEGLAGARPARQLQPMLSERGRSHLSRLVPVFASGHRPRVLRVLTASPARDVIELTVIVVLGPRIRALAARLERVAVAQRPPRWLCTAIEAA